MTNEDGDLHAKLSHLYYKVEKTKGKNKILKERFSTCLKLLQEIIDNPVQSEHLAQKAISSLELNLLVLVKEFPKSYRDYWSLQGLSYETGGKYLPRWSPTRDYRENNLVYMGTFDPKEARKLTKKMTQLSNYYWEYIGHIKDLVND